MNRSRFTNIGLGILFLLVQILLFRHLKIFQVQPDLVLIFLIWYAAKHDRTSAIMMAAGLGFMQDALLDLWGLNMFTKTLLVFTGYNFIPRNADKQMVIGQVVLAVFITCLIHNLIFLILNMLVENYTSEIFFWWHLLGNSLYTTGVTAVIYLFRAS